jgi:molybdate transport system substrate-binding protein
MRAALAVATLALATLALAACGPDASPDSPESTAEPLRVAVVQSFAASAREIVRAFEKADHTAVELEVAPAEQLDQQIRAGAGYAVLLAADEERPRRLEADGHAVPGTRATYAIGQLALWSPDPARTAGEGLLRSGDFASLAIPDPAASPYGAAARQVLDRLVPGPGLADKLRLTADPGEALGTAASGGDELAMVAASQLTQGEVAKEGSRWIVPPGLHDPIRHQAVVLTAGRDDPRARRLLAFLAGPEAQAVLERYGYGVEQALE